MKRFLQMLKAKRERVANCTLATRTAEYPSTRTRAEPTQEQQQVEERALVAAQIRMDEGDLAGAKRLLAPLAAEASNVRTLIWLSRISSHEGAFGDAVELLKRAELLAPANKKVLTLLAALFCVQLRHAEEVDYRRKLVTLDPDASAETWVHLAQAIVRATPNDAELVAQELEYISAKLSGRSDLTAALLVGFAESLYAFDSLADEARVQYRRASPCPPADMDVSAEWVRLPDWCTHSGSPMYRLTSEGTRGRRPTLAELSDAWVFPGFQWVPVLDGGRVALSKFQVSRLKLHSEEPLSPVLMGGKRGAELRVPRILQVIDEPALLVGGAPQYYHNTIEYLSALAVAETLGVATHLPLVVNDDLAPFQLEQLALLGYGQDRLMRVRADRPVSFKQLMVPTRLAAGGRWMDPLLPRWYRQRLAAPFARPSGPRKLYLSRRDTGRRRVYNEEELALLLRAAGYEVICPERLSVRAQIELFAHATHIVAPTGAALTNMVYAPPGAQVVVLYSRHLLHGNGDLYFDALAQACGHRFSSVACPASHVHPGQRVIDADLLVDIDAVRSVLN